LHLQSETSCDRLITISSNACDNHKYRHNACLTLIEQSKNKIMKKVILAIEANHFPEAALNFVKELHQQEPILLAGAFLPQAQLAEFYSYPYGVAGPYLPVLEDTNPNSLAKDIQQFEEFCKSNNMRYSIHEDFYDSVTGSLKKEGIYADLAILSSSQFYSDSENSNTYLDKVLRESACPVVVLPENAGLPDNLIFAFDGSEDSLYAIKQFVYLFPFLAGLPVEITYVHEDAKQECPDEKLIKEWAGQHFTNVKLSKLEINAKKYFGTWISERKNTLLVCGSFARSGFSNILNRSFVKDVIARREIPVFIAHH